MSDQRPVIMAIDPGPEQSAWIVYHAASGALEAWGIWPNDKLLRGLREGPKADSVVIEKVESFGMPVGRDVFETVYWSGQFAEAAHPLTVDRIGRKAVKIHLCGSMRAKDPNIRQALLDRYGNGKAESIGTKRDPGPLYGISRDVWSALALAVTWGDQHGGPA